MTKRDSTMSQNGWQSATRMLARTRAAERPNLNV